MTTIACNKSSLACDLQFTYGGTTKFKGKTKVLPLEGKVCEDMFGVKKAFLGFAGNADQWGNVVNWFSLPEGKLPKMKNIEFLLLTDAKKIYHGTNLSNWMLIPEPFFAIGSGRGFALAAMASGKSPLEACKVASKFDINTGLGFLDYKL